MAFSNLLLSHDGPTLTITINRPRSRNALDPETVTELREALRAGKANPDVRVMVLTGSGDFFCAGADLQGFRSERSQLERYFERRQLADLFLDLTALGKPTIAQVNGVALAAGFGLVAACDLAVAAEEAQFAMPEVNVGVWPMMIMAPVFRSLSRKAGMELMLTGKRIGAREAQTLGLINRCVPADRLPAEVSALAQDLAAKSPIGMRLGLEAFYQMSDMTYSQALAYLQDQLAVLGLSEDLREGVEAFFAHRQPRFQGR